MSAHDYHEYAEYRNLVVYKFGKVRLKKTSATQVLHVKE